MIIRIRLPLSGILFPGPIILGQPAMIIDHADLVRQVLPPLPEDKIAVMRPGPVREAGHNDACGSAGEQSVGELPSGWGLAAIGHILPRIGKVAGVDVQRVDCCI